MRCCFKKNLVAFLVWHRINAFQSMRTMPMLRSTDNRALSVHNTRDVDVVGDIIGGVRYSLVPMPDAMKETTAYVGNLCEFVRDEDLSHLFAQVSSLITVPSCVVRKIDTTSLRYGFVAFPTLQEKEAAIIRFDGFEWKGKRIKVESIRDHPKSGSVRIPESMVDYVYGSSATTTMTISATKERPKRPHKRNNSKVPKQNNNDTARLSRALRRGYLILESRQHGLLFRSHRQYCGQQGKPQILLYKATGTIALDHVVFDLSPLQLTTSKCVAKWKAQIVHAADTTGMQLANAEKTGENDEDATDEAGGGASSLPNTDKLPVLDLGTFQGERARAKRMASMLAKMWGIPSTVDVDIEQSVSNFSDRRNNGRGNKRKRQSGQRRKRGGGHRQDGLFWD